MLHIIVTAYNRPTDLKRLIYDFILQTNMNWNMRIIHDGPAPDGMEDFVNSLNDNRVSFQHTETTIGSWGHPNRRRLLEETEGDPDDYVLMTNDDNQYLKCFVDTFRKKCNPQVGFVYCDTIHSYWNYAILRTQVRIGGIDMGSFIVKLDVAKKIGFTHTEASADGMYAEECAAECMKRGLQIINVNKALFIHN